MEKNKKVKPNTRPLSRTEALAKLKAELNDLNARAQELGLKSFLMASIRPNCIYHREIANLIAEIADKRREWFGNVNKDELKSLFQNQPGPDPGPARGYNIPGIDSEHSKPNEEPTGEKDKEAKPESIKEAQSLKNRYIVFWPEGKDRKSILWTRTRTKTAAFKELNAHPVKNSELAMITDEASLRSYLGGERTSIPNYREAEDVAAGLFKERFLNLSPQQKMKWLEELNKIQGFDDRTVTKVIKEELETLRPNDYVIAWEFIFGAKGKRAEAPGRVVSQDRHKDPSLVQVQFPDGTSRRFSPERVTKISRELYNKAKERWLDRKDQPGPLKKFPKPLLEEEAPPDDTEDELLDFGDEPETEIDLRRGRDRTIATPLQRKEITRDIPPHLKKAASHREDKRLSILDITKKGYMDISEADFIKKWGEEKGKAIYKSWMELFKKLEPLAFKIEALNEIGNKFNTLSKVFETAIEPHKILFEKLSNTLASMGINLLAFTRDIETGKRLTREEFENLCLFYANFVFRIIDKSKIVQFIQASGQIGRNFRSALEIPAEAKHLADYGVKDVERLMALLESKYGILSEAAKIVQKPDATQAEIKKSLEDLIDFAMRIKDILGDKEDILKAIQAALSKDIEYSLNVSLVPAKGNITQELIDFLRATVAVWKREADTLLEEVNKVLDKLGAEVTASPQGAVRKTREELKQSLETEAEEIFEGFSLQALPGFKKFIGFFKEIANKFRALREKFSRVKASEKANLNKYVNVLN